jgi:tetratricopeptide (TPR) repeat protein
MDRVDAGDFHGAIPLLRQAIAENPTNWNLHYLLGLSYRFRGDTAGAIPHLRRAEQLNSTEPSIGLALGIALQLSGRLVEAKDALWRAIELDPDYVEAYNSLALTQRKLGELDKALHNYELGARVLARVIVNGLQNDRASRIYKHRDTRGTLWTEYAIHGAIILAVSDEPATDRISFPTGEQAIEEEHTERHGGLYFVDRVTTEGERVRHFLPNYFNTFRETLRADPRYANLIGNRGTVLDLLGREGEAAAHFDEATEFMPAAR